MTAAPVPGVMGAKHTPGPWIVRGPAETNVLDHAAVVHDPGEGCEYILIADTYDIEETLPIEQRVANARLIAAAPELLDALKTAEEILSGLRPNNDTLDALEYARAIIAKATGGA